MSRSTGTKKPPSKHPLVVCLWKLAKWHRGMMTADRLSRKLTPPQHVSIRAFYLDTARLHLQVAQDIEAALRNFPLSPESVRAASSRRAGRSFRKGGVR